MAVYTRITKEELEDFLQKFELGKLIDFNEISEGVENSNFKITTNLNSYILTIFEKRVSLNDLPFFINLMNHLYLNNFKCPKPIQNIKAEYIGWMTFIYLSFIIYYSPNSFSCRGSHGVELKGP